MDKENVVITHRGISLPVKDEMASLSRKQMQLLSETSQTRKTNSISSLAYAEF